MARREDETVTAAVLATLVEVATWSPMIYAGIVGLDAASQAAVFAAARVAGVASWGYQAVVATTGPRLAAAIASRDVGEVRRRVHRAARTGLAATLPAVVAGLVLADELVELLISDPSPAAADALRALLVARLVDAATGPVGEAYVVGRRVGLDIGLIAAGLLAGAVVALSVEGTVVAVALIAAGAAVTTNLLRVTLFESHLAVPLARSDAG